MTRHHRPGARRAAAALLLMGIALAVLSVRRPDSSPRLVSSPESVAVAWITAWTRRDVTTLCRPRVGARADRGINSCAATLRAVYRPPIRWRVGEFGQATPETGPDLIDHDDGGRS